MSVEPMDIEENCAVNGGTKTGYKNLIEMTRHVYVILVEKPLGKRPLMRLRSKRQDNMM
jgi:hypothetical protein